MSCCRRPARRSPRSSASRRAPPACALRRLPIRAGWRTCCRRRPSADPGSLPLLEFVLDALYEAGRERRLLTFAAYRALGGLEGAIARRADEVVDALPPDIQDALPAVLRALTTVRLGDEAITAGPASLADVAGTPAQAALVDALIAARLLVSDEDAEGHAVIRVAHEALLSRWPRARDIVNANRDFLETRARIQSGRAPLAFGSQEPGASAAARKAARRRRGIASVETRGSRRSNRRLHRGVVIGAEGRSGEGATSRASAHRGRGRGRNTACPKDTDCSLRCTHTGFDRRRGRSGWIQRAAGGKTGGRASRREC